MGQRRNSSLRRSRRFRATTPCRIAVAPVQHRLLIPRIVMIGGFQECYKIRVTEELVDAVTYGAFSQVPPMMSLPFLAHIIA